MRRLSAVFIVLATGTIFYHFVDVAKGQAQTRPSPSGNTRQAGRPEIKPYDEVITAKAKTDEGLFDVHRIEDKLYYEIPTELLDEEMLLVSRRARTAANIGYGGEKNNTETVRWQRHDKKILLRIVSYTNVANDSLPIYEAVVNANFEPIVMAFDIAAFNIEADSASTDTLARWTSAAASCTSASASTPWAPC